MLLFVVYLSLLEYLFIRRRCKKEGMKENELNFFFILYFLALV